MSNSNLNRMVRVPTDMRLNPPEPMPESFLKRFPELRDWEAKNLEIWKRNEAELRKHISIAAQSPTG